MTRVAVVGATGRLGQQVVRVVNEMHDFEVVARLNSSSDLGEMDGAELVIDVTRHDVSESVIARARANGQRLLVGTSGWSTERLSALDIRDDESVTVIPNFSLGSTVATHVSGIVARFFPEARIDETHHINKADAPSGTSVRTAEVIAAETQSFVVRVNAVLSGTPELREILADARRQPSRKTVLVVDEIHRFNKAQQDLLLPDVEATVASQLPGIGFEGKADLICEMRKLADIERDRVRRSDDEGEGRPALPSGAYLIYPFVILTTWFHEMGHGLAALLAFIAAAISASRRA